jgi:hypothetical protein
VGGETIKEPLSREKYYILNLTYYIKNKVAGKKIIPFLPQVSVLSPTFAVRKNQVYERNQFCS